MWSDLYRAQHCISRRVPGLKYIHVVRDSWTRLNVLPAKIIRVKRTALSAEFSRNLIEIPCKFHAFCSPQTVSSRGNTPMPVIFAIAHVVTRGRFNCHGCCRKVRITNTDGQRRGYERRDVGLMSKYGVHSLNEATFAYSIYGDRRIRIFDSFIAFMSGNVHGLWLRVARSWGAQCMHGLILEGDRGRSIVK